jgi:hypothetical protein
VTGSVADGVFDGLREVDVSYVALEFGTQPLAHVLDALRADHVLHSLRDADPAQRICVADAFYVDAARWGAAVYGRFADFVARTARALRRPD